MSWLKMGLKAMPYCSSYLNVVYWVTGHPLSGTNDFDTEDESTLCQHLADLGATMTTAVNLLEIPSEIRNQIWRLVFADQFVVPARTGRVVRHVGCLACSKDDHISPELWNETYSPLLTCRQIYREAAEILHSTFTVYLGDDIFNMTCLTSPYPMINHKVNSAVLWVHIDEATRVFWAERMKTIGDSFSSLHHLTIKAHMRPPNSYDVLVDAISLAVPIVRFTRDKPDMEVVLQFNYTYEDLMFESPYLGEIRTTDALEEHELVIRDLIEDDVFVEAALDQDEDEQVMVAALLRTARAHEQTWFTKLQQRRIAQQREQTMAADAGADSAGDELPEPTNEPGRREV